MEHTGYRKFLKKKQQRVVPERTASDCCLYSVCALRRCTCCVIRLLPEAFGEHGHASGHIGG